MADEFNYTFWLWRSRVLAAVGVALILGTLFYPPLKEVSYSGYVFLLGLALTFVGVLDAFGIFQRSKIKQAIAQREKARREKYQAKQPWET